MGLVSVSRFDSVYENRCKLFFAVNCNLYRLHHCEKHEKSDVHMRSHAPFKSGNKMNSNNTLCLCGFVKTTSARFETVYLPNGPRRLTHS